MVLQLDTAEDPRSKVLYPERYVNGGPWQGPPRDPLSTRCLVNTTFTKSEPASRPDLPLLAYECDRAGYVQ